MWADCVAKLFVALRERNNRIRLNASLNQCCVRVWPLYRHVHVGGSLSIYSLIGETPTNWGPSFNVCPTDEVGVVVARDGTRGFERMRWGLIPRWWSQPLKELRLATFNARAETARTKPFFREAFKDARCLMPVSRGSARRHEGRLRWEK